MKRRRTKSDLEQGRLPAAELERAITRAEADRIPPYDLPELVALHRAGDIVATKRLNDGFSYLIWAAYQSWRPRPSDKRVTPIDMLGTWGDAVATVIHRLKDNDSPAAELEAAIRTELYFGDARYQAEISGALSADKHVAGDEKAKRSADTVRKLRTGETIHILDDPQAPAGEIYRRTSRYDQPGPDDLAEQADEERVEREAREAEYHHLLPAVQTDFEAAALDYFRDPSAGHAHRIASASHATIAAAIGRLRERAA